MHVVMGMLIGLGLLVAIVVAVVVWREDDRDGTPTGSTSAASRTTDTPRARSPE